MTSIAGAALAKSNRSVLEQQTQPSGSVEAVPGWKEKKIGSLLSVTITFHQTKRGKHMMLDASQSVPNL